MPTIALTGNFGMGKTTVLQLFSRLGAYTINIDDVVQVILERPSTLKKISRLLGREVLSKSSGTVSIDKQRTAALIFNDSEKRKGLERIIHPEALKEIQKMEAAIIRRRPDAVIVFEIPLLFEAGYDHHFDWTVAVHTTRDTALTRLSRKGFSRSASLKRITAQMPITRKKRLADFCIDNNGGIEKTERRVKRIFNKILTH